MNFILILFPMGIALSATRFCCFSRTDGSCRKNAGCALFDENAALDVTGKSGRGYVRGEERDGKFSAYRSAERSGSRQDTPYRKSGRKSGRKHDRASGYEPESIRVVRRGKQCRIERYRRARHRSGYYHRRSETADPDSVRQKECGCLLGGGKRDGRSERLELRDRSACADYHEISACARIRGELDAAARSAREVKHVRRKISASGAAGKDTAITVTLDAGNRAAQCRIA